MAGIDMSMVPEDYTFYNDLLDLVTKGEVPMSRIDDAVSRIFKMKFEVNYSKM
jgi:beta-glucosidase